jgi:hypothetical protein
LPERLLYAIPSTLSSLEYNSKVKALSRGIHYNSSTVFSELPATLEYREYTLSSNIQKPIAENCKIIVMDVLLLTALLF